MGREMRRVPRDWFHPRAGLDEPMPLLDGYHAAAKRWDDECALWCSGVRPDWADDEETRIIPNTSSAFADWYGERPDPGRYMLDWPASERTHYQMYETTSEGTPISPVMETPEALARWLVDNGASDSATYEDWLSMIRGPKAGWKP